MKKVKMKWFFPLLLLCSFLIVATGCGEDDPVCTTIGAPCDDGNIDTYNDAFNSECECVGTLNMFVDTRDGQSYNTVKIGTQTWMKENLNYITLNSTCFDNLTDNCDIYGRLYHGVDAKSGCPVGWHLPSKAEWTLLVDFLGSHSVAGGKLKEAGEAHWMAPNTGATNESGFTALPGGNFQSSGSDYFGLEQQAYWWSATHEDPDEQWVMILAHDSETVQMSYDESYGFGLSVRCVRD